LGRLLGAVHLPDEIERLKPVLAKLRRMQLGCRSEKLDLQIERLEFKLEDLEAEAAVAEAQAPAEMAPRRKAERKPLPVHLPDDESVLRGPGRLPGLWRQAERPGRRRVGGAGICAGELAHHPPCSPEAGLRLLRSNRAGTGSQPSPRTRPACAGFAGTCAGSEVCRPCAPVPTEHDLRARGRGAGALPAGQLGARGQRAATPAEALRRHVFAAAKLHADDTPPPVLAAGTGKTCTARLWTHVRGDRPSGATEPPTVSFAYSPDRKGGHPQAHLAKPAQILTLHVSIDDVAPSV
jgi:hypothetical protein